jgi:ribosomal-protein-alanine N-acetyltransferase
MIPELRTARLLLRPFAASDVEDALAYRDDLEFARFLPHIPQPFTRRDAEAFVALNMGEAWDKAPTFAVVLDGKVIGTVSFAIDSATRTAMLGYAIGRAYWGRGIAVEAARAAMAWAIATFALTRMWAATDARNLRSVRVLEKLGLTRETVRVADHTGRDGTPVDEIVYACTTTRDAILEGMTSTRPLIMIADDDPAIVNLLVKRLEHKDYSVVTASDGAATLEQVRTLRPDLVLLDFLMPGKSGLQVVKELRADQELRNVGVIMISAIGAEVNAMTSLLYGADDCVDKPFNFPELDKKIQLVLSKRKRAP